MRILFLSRWYPFPPDNGARARTSNVLRQLAREHEVSLISFSEQPPRADDSTGQVCRDVRVLPYRGFRPTSLRAVVGLLSAQPRSFVDVYNETFAAAVETHLATRETDLIVAATLEMMPYALRMRAWPLLMEEIELSQYRDRTCLAGDPLGSMRGRLTWAKLGRYLRQALPAFAACTVVSERERQNLAEAVPGYRNVHVLPNAVDPASYRDDYGPWESDSIVFAGALTYGPNYLGAQWLLSKVLPRLTAVAPKAHVRITGGLAGVDVAGLPQTPNCELTGYVSDVHELVARSAVSIVPLLSGGGTRVKILESMSLGTPVVSTSKGAEGLDVRHDENILIADDPTDFAQCVERVLHDARLRARLAEGGRALVRARYDWNVVGNDLRALAREAAARPARLASGARS